MDFDCQIVSDQKKYWKVFSELYTWWPKIWLLVTKNVVASNEKKKLVVKQLAIESHLTYGDQNQFLVTILWGDWKFLISNYLAIEIMWQPKDIWVTIGFTTTKPTPFSIPNKPAPSTQDGFWPKLTLG